MKRKHKIDTRSIPIFFTFDKNYVLPAAVAFQSLLDNGCSLYQYNLHVLTLDNIPSKEKRRLKNVVDGHSNANLTFRNIERSFDEKWSDVNQAHYSKDIFNKLIPASVFAKYDWIICSDVDVVFEGDISDIISFDFSEYHLSGVKSIKEVDQYIERAYDDEFVKEAAREGVGGGFLIYNLRKIRDDDMEKNILNNLDEYSKELVQPEQDVLNVTFEDNKGHLPLRFTSCTYIYSTIREGSFDTSTSGNWWYYMKEKHFSEVESGKHWSATQISEAL